MDKQKTILDFIAFLCQVEFDEYNSPENLEFRSDESGWIKGHSSSLNYYCFCMNELRIKQPETVIEFPVRKEADNG